MSPTRIALIEGDENETEYIQTKLIANLGAVECDQFESIDAFVEGGPQIDEYELIISDLLEEYTEDTSEEAVVEELADSFSGLLPSPYEDRDVNVVFLTKVPLSYIKRAIVKEIDRFPTEEYALGGRLKSFGYTRYDRGDISIIEKPYEKDIDGSLVNKDQAKKSSIVTDLKTKLSA
jgi:hypothetical protein